MTALDMLLDCPLFAGTCREDLPIGLRDLRIRRYGPGQMVFNQEDESGEVYFPRSGLLLALHLDQNGRELIFTRLTASDYFGELSAIDAGRRSLSVIAKTEASLVVMPRQAFLALLERVPLVRERVMVDLSSRIRRLTNHVYQITSQTIDRRLKAYLAHRALESGVFRPAGELPDTPTHAEIAASIGASREEVSRAISALKRSGIIASGRQRLTILQPNGLLGE